MSKRDYLDGARSLWKLINETENPDADFPTRESCQLFDAETGRLDGFTITPRAQNARCIFCNKRIATWGKNKKRTRQPPQQLIDAVNKHSYACAEDWIWRKLANWSLGKCRSPGEQQAIDKWRDTLKKDIARSDTWGWRSSVDSWRFLLAMFDRLPTNDINVVQAIELGLIAGFAHEVRAWLATDQPVPIHGVTEANPHVLFPVVVGDAKRGVWGMCTCGQIEFRGEHWAGIEEPERMWVTPPAKYRNANIQTEPKTFFLNERHER